MAEQMAFSPRFIYKDSVMGDEVSHPGGGGGRLAPVSS